MERKLIVFTGGGTAGHVTPNLAIMPLVAQCCDVAYIGSKTGIEGEMVRRTGCDYYAISSGKLRRYFSLRNFTDPVRILAGYAQAKKLLKKLKPAAVFSKGGFVTVPVVYAAAELGIPVVSHESDVTPGLANRLAMKKTRKICVTFEETLPLVGAKGVYTGTPIRSELFSGDRARGLKFIGFDGSKNVLLIMGGSLGAVAVNSAVEAVIERLTQTFDVAHIRGAGNLNPALEGHAGYRQFEFIAGELPDVFAATDIMLSRAGANAVCEIEALRIPALLVPLPGASSRGDQLQNARIFESRGYSEVLLQENITGDALYTALLSVLEHKHTHRDAMAKSDLSGAAKTIANIILQEAGCSALN